MTPKIFTKAWGILMLVLVIIEAFFFGSNLSQQKWQFAAFNAVFLAFWVFGLVWYHYMTLREQKDDLEYEQSKKELDQSMKDLVDETLGKIKENMDHDNKVEKALADATTAIAGKGHTKPLKPSQYAATEKKFHELLPDHYLKLELNKSDPQGRAIATVSDKPFEITKKAPVKKPVAKKASAKKNPTTKKEK